MRGILISCGDRIEREKGSSQAEGRERPRGVSRPDLVWGKAEAVETPGFREGACDDVQSRSCRPSPQKYESRLYGGF